MEIKHIGIVGLGRTGSAIAARLGAKGLDVTAYDQNASKVAAAVASGARPARIPADAAEQADLVVVAMPDEIAAEEALFDLGGVGETLREGGYVLDASATGPEFSRAATARLARFGIVRIELSFDRPAGQLPVLAGCAPDDLAAVAPVLMLLADDVAAA
jgi:3-hydroxyisobutyrate dehydrogenase